MEQRSEQRFEVDFLVFLSWQDKTGVIRRMPARCRNLSPYGAQLQAIDRIEPGTVVTVHAEGFGRLGNGSVIYCLREGMQYLTGLQFVADSGVSDPVRRRIMEAVGRPKPKPS